MKKHGDFLKLLRAMLYCGVVALRRNDAGNEHVLHMQFHLSQGHLIQVAGISE